MSGLFILACDAMDNERGESGRVVESDTARRALAAYEVEANEGLAERTGSGICLLLILLTSTLDVAATLCKRGGGSRGVNLGLIKPARLVLLFSG